MLETPTKINELLSLGKIEGGLCSSIYYGKAFEELSILPDLSISAVGKVKSVCLFHRVPLPELTGKLIGITPETETSFVLLRIVLEEMKGITPNYVWLKETLSQLVGQERETSSLPLSAYLAIGNEALELLKKSPFPLVTDLAELWFEETGYPFVFALVAVKRSVEAVERKLLRSLAEKLYLSRARSLANLESLVKDCSFDLPVPFLFHYLRHLEYDLSGLKQRALLHFFRLAKGMGILKEIPKLRFVEI